MDWPTGCCIFLTPTVDKGEWRTWHYGISGLLEIPYDACLPTLLGHAPCFFPFDFSGGQVSCSSSQGHQDLRLLWVLVFAGHKDSVTCAGFSHDSTLVATGDMSGLLKVWQVDTKEEVWSFEAGDLEVSLGPWTRRRVQGGV